MIQFLFKIVDKYFHGMIYVKLIRPITEMETSRYFTWQFKGKGNSIMTWLNFFVFESKGNDFFLI